VTANVQADAGLTRRGISRTGRWLSIREIAEDLGISLHTAYKWSARGTPHFPRTIRLRNREVRVRRDWYEAWLRQFEES
jgi:excisionase family DNA binding protein